MLIIFREISRITHAIVIYCRICQILPHSNQLPCYLIHIKYFCVLNKRPTIWSCPISSSSLPSRFRGRKWLSTPIFAPNLLHHGRWYALSSRERENFHVLQSSGCINQNRIQWYIASAPGFWFDSSRRRTFSACWRCLDPEDDGGGGLYVREFGHEKSGIHPHTCSIRVWESEGKLLFQVLPFSFSIRL